MQETPVQFPGQEDPLEKEQATHSSILAWRIPWAIQSVGFQRVGHDWATFTLSLINRWDLFCVEFLLPHFIFFCSFVNNAIHFLCKPSSPSGQYLGLREECIVCLGGASPSLTTWLSSGQWRGLTSPAYGSRQGCSCWQPSYYHKDLDIEIRGEKSRGMKRLQLVPEQNYYHVASFSCSVKMKSKHVLKTSFHEWSKTNWC